MNNKLSTYKKQQHPKLAHWGLLFGNR